MIFPNGWCVLTTSSKLIIIHLHFYAMTIFFFFFFIRKTRATFDTSDTRREFGPVIIDFAKVQSKVSLKYDSLHKETLSKFGSLLSNKMTSFHTQISKSRSDLELQSIEAASTSDAVTFITYVQSLKRNMKVNICVSVLCFVFIIVLFRIGKNT